MIYPPPPEAAPETSTRQLMLGVVAMAFVAAVVLYASGLTASLLERPDRGEGPATPLAGTAKPSLGAATAPISVPLATPERPDRGPAYPSPHLAPAASAPPFPTSPSPAAPARLVTSTPAPPSAGQPGRPHASPTTPVPIGSPLASATPTSSLSGFPLASATPAGPVGTASVTPTGQALPGATDGYPPPKATPTTRPGYPSP